MLCIEGRVLLGRGNDESPSVSPQPTLFVATRWWVSSLSTTLSLSMLAWPCLSRPLLVTSLIRGIRLELLLHLVMRKSIDHPLLSLSSNTRVACQFEAWLVMDRYNT